MFFYCFQPQTLRFSIAFRHWHNMYIFLFSGTDITSTFFLFSGTDITCTFFLFSGTDITCTFFFFQALTYCVSIVFKLMRFYFSKARLLTYNSANSSIQHETHTFKSWFGGIFLWTTVLPLWSLKLIPNLKSQAFVS